MKLHPYFRSRFGSALSYSGPFVLKISMKAGQPVTVRLIALSFLRSLSSRSIVGTGCMDSAKGSPGHRTWQTRSEADGSCAVGPSPH